MTDEFLLDFEKFVSEQEYSISKLVFFCLLFIPPFKKKRVVCCFTLVSVCLFVTFLLFLYALTFRYWQIISIGVVMFFFYLCFWWEHIYITKRWNFTLFYYVVSKIILFIWRVLLNSRAIEPTLLTMNSNCVNHSAF